MPSTAMSVSALQANVLMMVLHVDCSAVARFAQNGSEKVILFKVCGFFQRQYAVTGGSASGVRKIVTGSERRRPGSPSLLLRSFGTQGDFISASQEFGENSRWSVRSDGATFNSSYTNVASTIRVRCVHQHVARQTPSPRYGFEGQAPNETVTNGRCREHCGSS
jgi:hypothetical protein